MRTIKYIFAAIFAASCAGRTHQNERPSTSGNSTENTPNVEETSTEAATPTDEVAIATRGGSLGRSNPSNLRADGRVTTTLGPHFRNATSSDPLWHVYQAPDGDSPARIYLAHQVIDKDGNSLTFEINYGDEKGPFPLSGSLQTEQVGAGYDTEDFATSGTVTVSVIGPNQVDVFLQGIEMAHLESDGVTRTARPALGDGHVTGEVERRCVIHSGGGDRVDSQWQDPFCARYAQ
jgi:hypothetical protein